MKWLDDKSKVINIHFSRILNQKLSMFSVFWGGWEILFIYFIWQQIFIVIVTSGTESSHLYHLKMPLITPKCFYFFTKKDPFPPILNVLTKKETAKEDCLNPLTQPVFWFHLSGQTAQHW